MVALVVGETRRLRVGSAGVLLSYHNPLSVASSYSLLANLFPGRIDLGLSKGSPNTECWNAESGRSKTGRTLFDERVQRILEMLRASAVSTASGGGRCVPHGALAREMAIWLLGSSEASAVSAARKGVSYALSLFHGDTTPQVLHSYAMAFEPGPFAMKPSACIAVAGRCYTKAVSPGPQAYPWLRHRLCGSPEYWGEKTCRTVNAIRVHDICRP